MTNRCPVLENGVVTTSPASDLPVCNFERLSHVGFLDPGLKRASYEGNGLSVSTDPDSWVQIARLGGAPVWEFDTSSLRLVDVLALSPAQTEAITDWALAAGLVRQATAWKVSWDDDELGERMSTIVMDEAEALDEAGLVEEISAMVATEALAEAVGAAHVRVGEAAERDLVMVAYFEGQFPDIDGLWWAERNDPVRLSAPRGVVFPRSMGALGAPRPG